MSIISVGIKNALERGESIENAIQSLENAGYSKEEINKAIEEVQLWNKKEAQNQIVNKKVEETRPKGKYKKIIPNKIFEINNSKNYIVYILIILLGFFFVIGAALLGLYWDQLF